MLANERIQANGASMARQSPGPTVAAAVLQHGQTLA